MVAIAVVGLALTHVAPASAQEPPATAEGAKPEGEAKDASKPAEPPRADPSPPAGPSLLDQLDDGTLPPVPPPQATPSPFQMEWHGYFRFRPDLLSNGHLGMAVTDKALGNKVITTSSVAPPLSLWPQNNNDAVNGQSDKVGKKNGETALSGASMRLRLQPTISVEQNIRIAMTLDILDNYVLGGSPDYAGALARPDVPLSGFTMSTLPGAIAVKEAYGEWKTLLGVLRVGRQSSHWGLGMLAHGGGGDGWDLGRPTIWYGAPRRSWEGRGYAVDGGNFNDRAAFITKIPKIGLYLSVFYDFLANGISDYDPARFDVQARDMTALDDVRQIGLVLMKRPLSDDDAAARQRELEDDRRGVFDWGVYSVYRTQQSDISEEKKGADGKKKPSSIYNLTDAGDAKLMVRDAKAFIGDVWARYEKRLSPLRRTVIEAEFATIQGSLADTNGIIGSQAKNLDINMFGATAKAALQDEGMGYFVDMGYASGNKTGCWGTFGKGDCLLSDVKGNPVGEVTGFRFNRNYQVDSLLFRELVGTVTNAMYLRPTVSINAYPWYGSDLLGLDLSVLQAIAVEQDGVPGNTRNIGTELSARGLIGRRGQALLDLTFAYAITGGAFDLKAGWYDAAESKQPENAWRLMSHLALMF
ncbi:MAG: hypothetical protein FJ100_02410 [Deltaproteobacteria bacterium]|nr:hypothetical protein [Deltaproteobacteria bacterium]